MKFSGKMWLMIVLKVTKKYGFTLSLETHFWKNHREKGHEIIATVATLSSKDREKS